MSRTVRRAPIDPRLWHRAPAFRWWVSGSVVIGLASTVALIVQATFLSAAVAAAFAPAGRTHAISHDLAGLVAVTLVRAVLAFGAEQAATGAARRTKTELRAAAIEELAARGPSGAGQRPTGDLAITLGHGLDALDGYVGRYLPRFVLAFLAPVVLTGWIARLDLLSAGILIVTLVLLPVFMILVGRLTAERVAARWSSLATLSGQFLDAVEGLATLRAFGRVPAQRLAIARTSDQLRRATLGTLKVALLSALVLETLAAVGTALVAVPLGLRLLSGQLLLAPALTILVLAPEVYLPLRRASAEFHASTDGLAALDAVFAILDGPESGQDEPRHGDFAPRSRRRPPPPHTGPPSPHTGPPVIELRDVVARYPGVDRRALGPLGLRIGAGEHLGVVGPSGAGKSTLVGLLAALVRPDEGRILVDGLDLGAIDVARWRARLSWVPQRPTLFSGTVADNLRLGSPSVPDDELWRALDLACLAEVVAALPGKLAARLAEHAETLSAGERQRLALARALVRDKADVVLLDEPSAHLDPATEADLIERLHGAFEGRSLLVVTHRPRPLDLVDRVVTLDGGQLVRTADPGKTRSGDPAHLVRDLADRMVAQ
ncbi:MAG: thiol reductant ABC exporter subunit CydD [Trebonia sp.]